MVALTQRTLIVLVLYLLVEVMRIGARGFVLKVDTPDNFLHAMTGRRLSWQSDLLEDLPLGK
jgi:hypothetical protein